LEIHTRQKFCEDSSKQDRANDEAWHHRWTHRNTSQEIGTSLFRSLKQEDRLFAASKTPCNNCMGPAGYVPEITGSLIHVFLRVEGKMTDRKQKIRQSGHRRALLG